MEHVPSVTLARLGHVAVTAHVSVARLPGAANVHEITLVILNQ